MSAWIVDTAVIDLLVDAFFRYEIPATAALTPDALGTLLWKENHRSVNYRYAERRRTPQYTHDNSRDVVGDGRTLGPVAHLVRNPYLLYAQLACYCYQSCEHPAWLRSAAWQYATALQGAILTTVGLSEEDMHSHPFVCDAPWVLQY